MIGKITGRLDMRGEGYVLIDTGGVGYIVYCSERTLALLPEAGEAVSLYTELVVREDVLQLFGFLTLAEKGWHQLLTSVQGIGAKVAMAILGTLGADGVGRAISLGDITAVRAAPGVGPKTAQRIILELKDKAPKIMALGAQGAKPAMVSAPPETATAPAPETPVQPAMADDTSLEASAQADTLSALINLGYGHGDAASAIAQAANNGAETTANLIREALKLLAPKG